MPENAINSAVGGRIKKLGWDEEKQLHYVEMDLTLDPAEESLLSNKHVVNSLSLIENSNSDNPSMTLQVTRNLYGQRDAFGIRRVGQRIAACRHGCTGPTAREKTQSRRQAGKWLDRITSVR